MAAQQIVSARDQAIASMEDRIKLLTRLADALAHEAKHQDKVLEARDCALVLWHDVRKLHARRSAAPRTPRRKV